MTFSARNPRIGVVGMGYVGQPLATAFANAGFAVTGYDIAAEKIEQLRAKRLLSAGAASSNGTRSDHRDIQYTSDAGTLRECEIIITAVPTPLTSELAPDLSMVRDAGRAIGEQLTPETTVVLESTVYPGATRSEFIPELEAASGLSAGDDFDVGYSPERINPGSERSLQHCVKPVSAESAETQQLLAELYGAIVEDVYLAPTIEAAEAAKCLENAQRDLNIAFINQFAIACDGIDGLDYEETLSVADSKWNFQRYDPGLVEGHCIPIDPYFLIDTLERNGESASLMREARTVNESVVDYILDTTLDAFSERRERLTHDEDATDDGDSTVVVCGLAYKPNVDDIRSHAKERLFAGLRDAGFSPVGYDPHVDPTAAENAFNIDVWPTINAGDAAGILLLTAHDTFAEYTAGGLAASLSDPPVIIDIFRTLTEPNRSDIIYRSL